MNWSKPLTIALLTASVALAGCESVEKKADRLYNESVELVDAGEIDRALVSLRGVFNANGQHLQARLLYADLQLQRGNLEQAYSHYLLASEQYPNEFKPRIEMSDIALRSGNWAEAERQVNEALRITPDDIRAQSIANVVTYQKGVSRDETDLISQAVDTAQAFLAATPGDDFSRQVVIDSLMRNQKLDDALTVIDAGLALSPDNRLFNQVKLGALVQKNDIPALGEQLKKMVQIFPDDTQIRSSMVRWYLATGDLDGGEQFMRDLIAQGGDKIAPRVDLIHYINNVRGYQAASAELDRLIADGKDERTFRMMKAVLIYENEDQTAGIAQMEALADGAQPSDETRKIQTTLARMLVAAGRTEQAQTLVETVLGQDSKDVEALKLTAGWMIDEDQVRDAILALRTALDQSPRDPETITLLARAYERDGNRELMAESLSLAVEASNSAPDEAIRYATYLVQNEKFLPAEDVILGALRQTPNNLRLLQMIGQIYVALGDWPRAEQVVQSMGNLPGDEAKLAATGLEATILQRMARTDESIDLLRNIAGDADAALSAQIAIVRTHLANGDLTSARAYMNELLATLDAEDTSPRTNGIRFMNAALLAVEGDYTTAENIYRDLATREPQEEAVWRAYAATLIRQGKIEEATALLDQALAALPENANLLWVKAGLMENAGRVEDAIVIYERIYAQNSGSTIIANNLASLLTTYRDDDESLQRAYQIARRLRGVQLPAMQDTYGWISYRLGNTSEALDYLEPAARALTENATVQYHLAKAYESSGRHEDAKLYFDRAIALWGDSSDPQLVDAKAALEQLTAPASTVE
ncbi:MAG: tetratricopeptide repeat protein [Qingshengfaniella sp.]